MKILKSAIFVFVILLFTDTLCSQTANSIFYTPKPYAVEDINEPVLSLNGAWDFCENPDRNFFKRLNTRKVQWSNIEVPGEWVMQGFKVEPGTAAAYRKVFHLPPSWKGKTIRVRFDGVYSLAKVWLNGHLVTSHEGGFTPFEADLTSFAKPGGDNEMIVSVQNESSADTLASATQYAAHQLGGITRKVEVFALPETFLARLDVETELDQNYQDAVLRAALQFEGPSSDRPDLKVSILLKDPKSGKVIQHTVRVPDTSPDENAELTVSIPVQNPRLWDPEHPELYEVFVWLELDGEMIEKVSQTIGFREIELVGNQVFVNGQAIKLRGVNRHEVHPTRGRSLTMQEWLTDAQLFKEANVNYIRTSHYPPGEEFISLCDSIGLFVECEAPICWVGHGANAHWKDHDPHHPDLYPIILQQNLEMVAQYRNHPSIIIWSMANESAWGPNWQKTLEKVNAADPTRPVSFHDQAVGGFNNYGSTQVQIANWHYPGPGGPDVARKYDRPMLFGEYAHLNTYNRREIVADPGVRDAWGRGLEKMFEDMYYSTGCLGGAIWSGVDDVFYLPDGMAIGYGEWGPIDSWRRKKPEYWHLKKIYSPIRIVDRDLDLPKPSDPILVSVENRHLYTNLNELDILWQLGDSKGRATANIEPGRKGILKIWTGRVPLADEELIISFVSPQGFVRDQYAFTFSGIENQPESSPLLIAPRLNVLERIVQVTRGEVTWTFDAASGKLRSVYSGDKEVIADGPELYLIPLSSGPCNTEHSLQIEPLNDPCRNWSGSISATGKTENSVYIEVTGTYEEAKVWLRYEFDSSDIVQIDYEIQPNEDMNPRQIGLGFTTSRTMELLEWKRTGQWSVYPDGHLGRPHGKSVPFPDGLLETRSFGASPEWDWESDTHEMGANDFRATRDQLLYATLTYPDQKGVKMIGEGKDAFRAWVDGRHIKFLCASFSTAGGDLFFSSHLASERQPMKAGEPRKARLKMTILQ